MVTRRRSPDSLTTWKVRDLAMVRSRSARGAGTHWRRGAAILAATVLLVTACSSSKNSGTAGSSSKPSGPTYTVGLFADLSGPAAATTKNLPDSVKAGISLAASEGYNIKYVTADTQSTAAGALAAAKKLVEQDKVFAVLAISSFTQAVAPYLTSKNVPVVGAAIDSTEWSTSSNMFSVFGYPIYTKVETTPALFFQKEGATNIAVLGFGASPASSLTAKSTAIAAQSIGLKVGYQNTQFPFGDTNVAPEILAMKNAGVNGFTALMDQATNFALLSEAKQQGLILKVPLLYAGYGNDLALAGPNAASLAQNAYFTSVYEPIEMNDAATQKFQAALKSVGADTNPGTTEYYGYLSVDAVVQGLKAAGANPTPAAFTTAMLGITNYNAAGLWGTHTLSFAMSARNLGGQGADNCYWYTQYQGTSFHVVSGAAPLCGTILPNVSSG